MVLANRDFSDSVEVIKMKLFRMNSQRRYPWWEITPGDFVVVESTAFSSARLWAKENGLRVKEQKISHGKYLLWMLKPNTVLPPVTKYLSRKSLRQVKQIAEQNGETCADVLNRVFDTDDLALKLLEHDLNKTGLELS